ncbi:AraC family transcriptional regulator [Peristeroidobacter agariperforans]|uniref:AraC family transcriptional regulator n=1 Tax=Peristeroidobacter agariperforans TaxID=268404 RepID=UPI00101E173E|nr:AraC family transcriptional regulator [Peristeroidobacter agariperforans]
MISVEVNGLALSKRSSAYGVGEAYFCAADDRETAVDRRYAFHSIGAVVDGEFGYAARGRRVTASRGAVIFGTGDEGFTVWKYGSQRVHRSVLAVEPRLVAEVAADCGLEEPRFPVEVISPSRASLALYGLIRRIAASPLDQTEAVIELLATAFGADVKQRSSHVSALESRRVLQVARDMEQRYAHPVTLDEMAGNANLSRYHFIRVFHAVTGETPKQRLIGIRLRAAADRLIATRQPITQLALEVGFNDISHFTTAFRQAFRVSPRAWRRID